MFCARKPSPSLAHAVSLFWYAEGATAEGAREWVLPSGTAQLLINLADNQLTFFDTRGGKASKEHLGGLAISGPFDRPLLVDTREQQSVCGVSFAPGGLSWLIGTPAHALANLMVDDDQVPMDVAPTHLHALREASDATTRLDRLERLVGAMARPTPTRLIHWACRQLEDPTVRIASLVDRSGVPKRRLVRTFTEAVGVSPKRYQRVRRLRRALVALDSPNEVGAIAHELGYFDQAHLNHDFAELAGMTPSRYRARRTGYVGHVEVSETEPLFYKR